MNPTHGITRRRAIAAVAAAAALPFRSLAQSERPVRVIVGSSAGATIDVMARTAQSALASALGAPVVVENVAGAGGVIAMQTLARSAPDGSVLVLHTNNMVIAPLLIKPAPYDPVADFTPIGMVGSIPLGIVVNPSKIQARDPKEFVAVLKTRGEALNYGSSGNGTTLHLAVELIQDEVGTKAKHIPYKGVAPMVNDLLGGQVDFIATSLPAVQGHIKSGALRLIGMLSDQRAAIAPDVPTFVEQGFSKSSVDVWLAAFGPKGMPAATVKRVHDALMAAFNNPTVKDTLEKQGNAIKVSSPDEARAVISQDQAKYSALAKKINLTPQ